METRRNVIFRCSSTHTHEGRKKTFFSISHTVNTIPELMMRFIIVYNSTLLSLLFLPTNTHLHRFGKVFLPPDYTFSSSLKRESLNYIENCKHDSKLNLMTFLSSVDFITISWTPATIFILSRFYYRYDERQGRDLQIDFLSFFLPSQQVSLNFNNSRWREQRKKRMNFKVISEWQRIFFLQHFVVRSWERKAILIISDPFLCKCTTLHEIAIAFQR